MGGRGSGGKPYRHLTRVGVPAPANVPEILPDDDEVIAEYEAVARQALAENTLGGYRRVHATAKVCHENGYDVRWHSLPYLIALSAAVIVASSARERNSLRAEIMTVYQDMRDWRNRDA